MKKHTLGEKFKYAFDNTMSKGTSALILWLAIVSFAIIVVVSIVVSIAGFAPDKNFIDVVWMGLMRTLDAGTMGGDEGSWPLLISMLAVTIGGIFVISTLIGVLTAGIEAKLEGLRKGRSRVVETNHTVVLGWTDQVFTIVSELALANANQRKSCVAILADKDKVEMEDELRDRLGSFGRMRVVCRRGNPMDLTDLEIIGIHASKAIIVLSPGKDDGADADVIKTILAVTNHPRRRAEPYHVVAEINDPQNMEVAKMVGKDEVELILVSDLVARVVAQTCRQSGLSIVYTELLDYGGDEIYFHLEPSLVGKTFGEILSLYDVSTVLGVVPRGGVAALNPPMDSPLHEGDCLIVIAEDDDTTKLSGITDYGVNAAALAEPKRPEEKPERTLVLGWNRRAPFIINELDNYVPAGSTVTVVADYEQGEAEIAKWCPNLAHQKCTYILGDTTDRRTLDRLNIPAFDHVIALSYSDALGAQEADARTLITLLHIRDIAEKAGRNFSITSEMLDLRNRDLAEVTQVDDFIVSDRLVSLMLAQVSENKQLNAVFADIFDREGSEIYLKPAETYVTLGVEINFYTVVEAARRRGAVAIGYKQAAAAGDAGRAYGVKVNPRKSDRLTFAPGDKVIVVAED
jgi:voltage-gated potassium channel Kch